MGRPPKPRPDPLKLVSRKPPLAQRDENGRQVAFKPTAEQRETVRMLTALGADRDQIEKLLDVTRHTLNKYFERELSVGLTEANLEVTTSLYKNATTNMSVPAQIFWLNSRAGWKQATTRIEHVGEDGGPVRVESIRRVIIDPNNRDT